MGVHRTNTAGVSAIDELNRAVTSSPITVGEIPISDLVMQSVVAHRLWANALNRKERFIPIDKITLAHDESARRLWSTVTVHSDLLRRRDWSVASALRMSGLAADFRAVSGADGYRTFEQLHPHGYTGRAADKVMDVVSTVRPYLWQTVTAVDPFRRYYLFLSQPTEKRLHQVVSVYALLFWLGSLTRYQPVELLELLQGTYGGFFREFLATQPSQLLYILASELMEKDVARPAIV